MNKTIHKNGERRRQRILAYMRDFQEVNGFVPTLREIASGVKLASIGALSHHIGVLEDQGLVMKNPGLSRSLRLTRAGRDRADGLPPSETAEPWVVIRIQHGINRVVVWCESQEDARKLYDKLWDQGVEAEMHPLIYQEDETGLR